MLTFNFRSLLSNLDVYIQMTVNTEDWIFMLKYLACVYTEKLSFYLKLNVYFKRSNMYIQWLYIQTQVWA